MKKLKDLLNFDYKQYYQQLKDALENENTSNKKTLHKRHTRYFEEQQNKELIIGGVVLFLIVIIIFSIGYYFLILSPNMEEIQNEKNIKINEVNSLFKDNMTDSSSKQAIISRINSANSVEEVDSIDVDSMAYPILKNELLDQINQYKDKYDRVQVNVNDTADIMSVKNASEYINLSTAHELADTHIERVDSVIIPLSINRKQAASGLLNVGDVIDIYKNNQNMSTDSQDNDENNSLNNTTSENDSTSEVTDVSNNEEYSNNSDTNKLVGGCIVVSILRSKDSGSIDSNMEVSESPNTRNITQTNSMDIQELLESESAGALDENQLNLLLDNYGYRLSNYERTSNLGDLDVDYIIMVEVPRDSVDDVISNMDNLIITIPTYDAPRWVNLTSN
ncbi:DUF515 domain-containing protein [Methanosphaera sp.]|jgi:hypothetical protein|uniref:DUF515 domain-containing protein n=1 Tax=Methanosphaera sp. TaxID=2666342 RepID=UPI003D8D438D